MATESVELRGPCPRDDVDFLDAYAMARDLNRMQLVNQIIREWCSARRHEHMVLGRVLRGNPPAGKPGE